MKPASPPPVLTLPTAGKSAGAAAAPKTGVVDSAELFGSVRELVIEHAGCLYRLRITQNNKLILTK